MSLKPAPFDLTEGMVSIVLGDRPAHSTRVVLVPVSTTQLVDVPRQSEDPRSNSAGDKGGAA